MPSALSTRRERGFRPQSCSVRHRLVADLLSQGKKRTEIARVTGYSLAHLSRIRAMPAVRREVASLLARRFQEQPNARTTQINRQVKT
jgi:uncharacterized protein YerC